MTERMIPSLVDPSRRVVRTSLTRMLSRLGASSLVLLFSSVLFSASASAALTEIGDEVLTDVTGEGLTFTWTDFRIMFDPRSYMEQMGSATGNTCTGTGSNVGNYNCWRRADLRWYGLNVSNTSTAVGQAIGAGNWNTTWTTTGPDGTGDMVQCTSAGVNGLGCPRGGPVALFAAHDNPYILRVQEYAGDGFGPTSIGNGVVTYQGNDASSLWSPTNAAAGSRQTALEWIAPTKQDNYRFSFWGELEVGRGGTGVGLLKSQTLLMGNARGSVLRFWKFTQTTTSPGAAAPFDPLLGAAGCTDSGCASVDGAGSAYNNRSLALEYQSHLYGDFRFSVAQSEAAPIIGTPVVFHATEGNYFRNADVFVPLGQPFYQALTLNVPRNTATNAPITDGNFTLEMPVIPNRTAVYTRFYSLNTTPGTGTTSSATHAWDYGYATSRAAYLWMTSANTAAYMPDADMTGTTLTNYPQPNANWYKTHGYARWGDWYPCQGQGCIYPTVANSAAQADAGVGRNSWRSDGDGVFFKNIATYNAYSYRPLWVDVRDPDTDTYTDFGYMSNYAACDNVVTVCGYGGDYLGAGSFGNPVQSVNIVPAENSWNKTAYGAPAARNVVVVPANGTLNIGDSRIEGLQLNYFRLSSYGANY